MPAPDDSATLTASIHGVDIAARTAEAKWGKDRLLDLIPTELRAKFLRQQAKVTATMTEAWDCIGMVPLPVLEAAVSAAAAMERAWAALDTAATTAGHQPSPGVVLAELRLGDGSIAALVSDYAEASLVLGHRSYAAVYSLAEVGNIIDSLPAAICAAKREWPEGEIIKPKRQKASVTLNDEVPF
jgi:hypothetical protein